MPVTAIGNRFSQVQAARAGPVLGTARGSDRWCTDNIGRIQDFASRLLIWWPTWGPRVITGTLADSRRSLDEAARLQRLDYRVRDSGDVEDAADLPLAVFEHGRLYARPSGVNDMAGAIYDRWLQTLDLEGGPPTIHHPVTGEIDAPASTRVNRFVRPTDGVPAHVRVSWEANAGGICHAGR